MVIAPLIVAIINGKPGGGSWKFLSFLLCLGVAGLIFVDYLVPAIILWGLAWACAATARTQVHRRSVESRHADAFAGQNKLLKSQIQQGSPNAANNR